MKKTIVLLLAAAGMAMGADLTIDNKENNAESSYDFISTTIEATVAINLNLKNLLDLEATIFTLEGPHTLGQRTIQVGLGIDISDTSGPYMDAVTANGVNYRYLDMDLSKTLIDQAAHGIVVFTLNQDPVSGKVALSELLFLYDKDGQMLTEDPYEGTSIDTYSASYASFTKFNINKGLFYEAQVYNSVLDDESNLADEMIASYLGSSTPGGSDSPTIPEPTTATLSLLALVGLAARRRRR